MPGFNINAHAETVFVRLTVPFVFGILTFYESTNPFWQTALAIACLLLFTALLILNICYLRWRAYRYKPLITVSFYLLSFLMAGLLTAIHKEVLSHTHFTRKPCDFLRIRIEDEPQFIDQIIRCKASVLQSFKDKRKTPASGHLLVSIKLDSASQFKLAYGDELLIPAQFDTLEPARNPFQFDTKSWYARQNIYHQTFVKDTNILKTRTEGGNALVGWAIRLRKLQVELYNKLLKGSEARAVASTLILGYRADLSAETLAAYSKTGTIHALSVSGMHVGLIYLVLQYALSFMDRRRTGKVVKFILVLSLIWFYALLTGLSPSVLRSVIMLSVYVLAKTFNQQTNSYNILCFSAFCMLIYNPFLLYDVGFQLSYLSVFGLVYLQPKINHWFHFKFSVFNKLWSALSLSLAAQLVTFPLATYYFHQFPVLFLVSNLFILLPMSLIMYLGIIILLTRFYFLGPIFEWLINFTNSGLEKISQLPFSVFSGIWLGRLELTLLILSTLLITLSLVQYQKKLLLSGLCILVVFLGLCVSNKWNYHDQRMLVFFSLPKGQATAFIQGSQATLLTNLDPGSSAFKFYVEPLLMHNQISSLYFIKKHQDFRYKQLVIKDHQIAFCGKHLLVVDSCLNRKRLQTPVKSEILLLSENSRVDIPSLLDKFRPAVFLLDGTNSAYYAAKLQVAAKNYDVPSYNLKKLKAYLVNIKE
jgi:competence protein ComEC